MSSIVSKDNNPPISLRSRFAHGVTWNVIGALFSQGSFFLCNIVLANVLGRKGYGEFGMIQNTVLTISSVAQLATGFAATKYVAEYRFADKERTGRILGLCSSVTGIMGVIATLCILACAPLLAAYALKASHLGTGLMIASGSLFFSVLNGYQMGALAGLESYGAAARIGAMHGGLHLVLCSSAGWLWGLNGVLAGFVVSALLRWLMFRRSLVVASAEQGITLIYHGIWSERDIFFRFALPAALSGLFSMPSLWLVNTILVRQPDGYSQMGLYSAANSLRMVILILPQLINNVSMSLMNSQKGLGNHADYKKVFWLNLAITSIIVLIGVLLICIFGGCILRIFGKDFTSGHSVLMVLALAVIPEALAMAVYQVIQSQGKMWLSFAAVVLPRDCTNIVAAYWLIPAFGAIGMASAYTISQIVYLVCISVIVKNVGLDYKSSKSI